MGKGRDAERMLFTAPKGNRIGRKALQPSSQPSELAAFYTPAKQHVPSTYLIALQFRRRSAPLGAECAHGIRALVRLLMPVSHHRRFDRGIWRHPAHCSDTTLASLVKGCARVSAAGVQKNAAAAALSYVYFRVAAKQR